MPPLDYILLATASMAHKNTRTNQTTHSQIGNAVLLFPLPIEFLSMGLSLMAVEMKMLFSRIQGMANRTKNKSIEEKTQTLRWSNES